ncbi:peptidylprolyl isomerase [Marinagarivorans algicola]|uniref:peptidylprolyl isomerase n=1 Tax=Marinagarivorans algicola TaxID=1513270 RepID=UPI0006B4B440|nr:peptidylprolyl isomerase [Marinagarivorans algicola]
MLLRRTLLQKTAKALSITAVLALSSTSLLACKQQPSEPVIELITNQGTIVIQLHPNYAPKTVALFLKHVDAGFYDNIIFHRVIPNFMAQTGGFNEGFIRKEPLGTVVNESVGGLPNIKGSVAMARTSAPDSASSQFYINVANNANLNARNGQPGYTVFGTVIEGQEVAPKITQLPQGQHAQLGYRNAPNASVIITSAKRLKPRAPLVFDTPLPPPSK